MKILTSHPNLKQVTKFDRNDLKFIQVLETDFEFENIVIEAREKCNIPKNGFNLDEPIKKYNYTNSFSKIDYRKLIDESISLTLLYWGLPYNWVITFLTIILFNVAFPPDKSSFKPIDMKVNESEVIITIRENISLKKIKSFLKNNQKSLNESLKTLPTGPKILVRDIDIKKRMLELKENGLSSKKLAKHLEEEYGNKLPFSADYEVVATEVARFKKYLKKILNKDWRTVLAFRITKQRDKSRSSI